MVRSFEKVWSPNVTLSKYYLLDGDVPWSEKESEHVLRFNKSPSKKKVRISRKEKQMVLKQVGEVFLKSSKRKGAGQPLVHFDGQYVYIRALSQELL